jgi:hypothetical protein
VFVAQALAKDEGVLSADGDNEAEAHHQASEIDRKIHRFGERPDFGKRCRIAMKKISLINLAYLN